MYSFLGAYELSNEDEDPCLEILKRQAKVSFLWLIGTQVTDPMYTPPQAVTELAREGVLLEVVFSVKHGGVVAKATAIPEDHSS